MINILHIINGWPPGGIAEQCYLLAKYLPKDQFRQYSIGYCYYDTPMYKKFVDTGMECLISDMAYGNLLSVIREKKIDIVIKQTGGGDCPEYVQLLHDNKIPLIEWLHCPRATSIPIDRVAKILYTTLYTLEKNLEIYHHKMQSIMYSLDLDGPIVDKVECIDKDVIKVGRLCRIVPDKRPDVLLQLAAMSWIAFGPKVEFHIAGFVPTDYEYHKQYGAEIVKQMNQFPNIKYHGFVDNKYDFWRTLDICINPVWETSFDIVFLEAMACGIPILTWDNSAAKYVVDDAGIITYEDMNSFYVGFQSLVRDAFSRQHLGNNGIRRLKEKMSLQNYIDKHIQVIQEIVGDK